jgi:hypothetical protein
VLIEQQSLCSVCSNRLGLKKSKVALRAICSRSFALPRVLGSRLPGLGWSAGLALFPFYHLSFARRMFTRLKVKSKATHAACSSGTVLPFNSFSSP